MIIIACFKMTMMKYLERELMKPSRPPGSDENVCILLHEGANNFAAIVGYFVCRDMRSYPLPNLSLK